VLQIFILESEFQKKKKMFVNVEKDKT